MRGYFDHGVGMTPVASAPAPTLNPLTLSSGTATNGSATTINILGATSGSTITLQSGSLPTGMTLDGPARTISGTPSAIASYSFTLRETLAGATNTPRDTALGVVVASSIPLVEIEANGWASVYDGTPPSDLVLTDFSYSEPGFDATGAAVTQSVSNRITKRIWGTWPNHNSNPATSTPNLYDGNRIALARKVRSGAVISGVTNNSTAISPKPIARWLTPDGMVIGNSLTVALVAYHMDWRDQRPVACVVLTATDGTTSVTATLTSTVVIGSAIFAKPVIGYQHTFDLSTLTDASQVRVRAQIYPWLGVPNGTYANSSVRDSDLEVQTDPEAFHSLYFLKHTTRAATPLIAYVNPTTPGGSPAASTVDATAKGQPFANLRAAVDAVIAAQGDTAGAVIRLASGETFSTLPTNADKVSGSGAALIIEKDSAVSGRQPVTVTSSTLSFRQAAAPALNAGGMRFPHVHFRGFDFTRGSGSSYFFGQSTRQHVFTFEDCRLDNAGYNGSLMQRSSGVFFSLPRLVRCTVLNTSGSTLAANPSSSANEQALALAVGNTITFAGNHSIHNLCLVGNTITNPGGANCSDRAYKNTVTACNEFLLAASNYAGQNLSAATPAGDLNIVGHAYVQNTIEWVKAGAADACVSFSKDSGLSSTDHVIEVHNTYTGCDAQGRCGRFYDETNGTRRVHRNLLLANNIYSRQATKGDIFVGISLGLTDQAPFATGWNEFRYGVGCHHSIEQYKSDFPVVEQTASGYQGEGHILPSGPSSPTNTIDMLFVDPKTTTWNGSAYVAGLGGSNLRLQAGSPAKASCTALVSHDLDGTLRPTGAGAAARGAYV